MKSFRLHRPKKGFQAIYKRKLTWKEKIKKFIFVPLLMGIFFLILTVLLLILLTIGTRENPEPTIEFQTLIDFIKSFFE